MRFGGLVKRDGDAGRIADFCLALALLWVSPQNTPICCRNIKTARLVRAELTFYEIANCSDLARILACQRVELLGIHQLQRCRLAGIL